VSLVSLVAKVAVLGVGLAAFEVGVAKLRLFRVPELMAGASCSPSWLFFPRWCSHDVLFRPRLAAGAVLVCAVSVLWLTSVRS